MMLSRFLLFFSLWRRHLLLELFDKVADSSDTLGCKVVSEVRCRLGNSGLSISFINGLLKSDEAGRVGGGSDSRGYRGWMARSLAIGPSAV